ncbi:hypothetical protein Hanom_Chr16g01434141 [Helianthus anomalus]
MTVVNDNFESRISSSVFDFETRIPFKDRIKRLEPLIPNMQIDHERMSQTVKFENIDFRHTFATRLKQFLVHASRQSD